MRHRFSSPDGTLRVERCRFVGNTSREFSGGGLLVEVPGRAFEVHGVDCTFEDNDGDFNGGATLLGVMRGEVLGNTFEDNTARLGGAVHIALGSAPLSTMAAEGDLRNRFSDNSADLGADIHNDTRADIDATGNCWGTVDLAGITQRIFDAADDPSKGTVVFDPIATNCNDYPADLDGDGELTLFDFLAFQTTFDAGCEQC